MPVSLPLTILLTSLVAFNGFNRHFRLLTVGTTKVSLLGVVHPLVILIFTVYYMSFCFRGIVNPRTRTGLKALLVSVGRGSPRISVPRKIFCSRVSNCGLGMREGSHGANVLCSIVVCSFSGGFSGTHVVITSSKHLRVATSGRRLCLRLCDNRVFRGLGTRDVDSGGIPCHHRSFQRGRSVVRFSSSFGVTSTDVVDGRSAAGSVVGVRTSVSSVAMLTSDVKERCFIRTDGKPCHATIKLAGRSALGVRRTRVHSCGMSDLFRTTALVGGRGVVTSTIKHARGLSDS